MNKRFLLPCLGLLCSLGSFAYQSGEYVFTPTQRLKITSDANLITNGDFSVQSPSEQGFGWTDANGATLSTELWSVTANGGYDGHAGLVCNSVTDASLFQAVPFTAGQTLMVTFKVKAPADGSFASSVTAGAVNYIDVYANTNGAADKTSEGNRFQQVAATQAIGDDWTDVTYCFTDTVSGGSTGSVIIALGRLPEGTVVSDFEVKEAEEVFDTRISDNQFKYTDYLINSNKFTKDEGGFVDGMYVDAKDFFASEQADDINTANEFLNSFIEARESWLDESSTELITYCSNYDITKIGKSSKGLTSTGDWRFTGGGNRWGHGSGSEYFNSSYPGNYGLDAQTCMIQRAVGAPFTAGGEFLFSMEGMQTPYYKAKTDGSYYTINYAEALPDVKMFVANDTVTWDNTSNRTYITYGAIGTVPTDADKVIVGIQFAGYGDHGGWVSCGKPSLRVLGYSETEAKRAKYISDVYTQQKVLAERLNLASEDIADTQRPWGKETLQDSVNVYKPVYDTSLTYVDVDGKDLKNPEMPESGYDATLLAAVKMMGNARNAFSNINKPFTNIVTTISNAKDVENLRLYSGSTKKDELDAAIAKAQALHDAKLGTTFNSEDSLALVNENTSLLAAIEAFKAAIPEKVVADIDFGTQENPGKIESRTEGEDGETVYFVKGNTGEMIISDSTACAIGYNDVDSLGMFRLGAATGTVKFEGIPVASTDIVKFSFDFYFGSLITRNAGWYIKDAADNTIAALYFSKYSGTSVDNTFNVDFNNKITGVGSSSASNSAIAASSNRTHFDVVLDYGRGKMYCETDGAKGIVRTDEVDLTADMVPASFMIQSNYDNNDRRCWFDNLKISNITAGPESGISDVTTGKTIANDVKYNIAGQRIMNPTKGQIYIMNGKKYMGK